MPTRPNLEYYRKQAKALLQAAQSGDSAALQRLKTQETPKLHDAQLAIAREQGFRADGMRALQRGAALEQPLDASLELFHRKRLRHVVVGAEVKPTQPVG